MATTESLTLAKALSIKNRLAGRLSQARSNIEAYNSVPAGQREGDDQATINVRAEYDRYRKLQDGLIVVKTAIQRANVSIYEDILRLGEVKSTIQMLNGLNTRHGSEPGYNNIEYRFDATYRKPEIMEMVRKLETEIDTIQDRITQYNATTSIDLPTEVLDLAR
jgi:hypothetical protein